MTSASICTCGESPDGHCDRTCVGAILQQLECAIRGEHQTANGIRARRGEGPSPLFLGEFCFRCGESGDDG